MARIKTFVNGGTVLPGDLDSIEDDYEVAFGTYKTVMTRAGMIGAGALVGNYVLAETVVNNTPTTAGSAVTIAYLDPARFWSNASTSGTNPRSVFYNLVVSYASNSSAIGTVTLTTGLYLVATSGGGGNASITLGASPITGSTVAIVNPAASTLGAGVSSGDFAAPAAGTYTFGVAVSAAPAASSNVALRATLLMRQI